MLCVIHFFFLPFITNPRAITTTMYLQTGSWEMGGRDKMGDGKDGEDEQ